MRTLGAWFALPLLVLAPGCVLVLVEGDLGDELLGESDFPELAQALESCLVEPEYGLGVSASLWHQEVEWTVTFCDGSDGPAAFGKAREAVLARIQRKGGELTSETAADPHRWSCTFQLDGEPAEASVHLAEARECPHRLVVSWEEDD